MRGNGGGGGGRDYVTPFFTFPPPLTIKYFRPSYGPVVQWSLRSLETIQPHDRDNYTPVQCTKSTKCGKNYYDVPYPLNFQGKKRIGGFENHSFFQSAILKLFFHIKIEA